MYLTWTSAGVAVAAAAVVWWTWLRASLNHRMFTDVVIKMLEADNLERARKLCNAAPGSPFVVAVGHTLAAASDGTEEPESERIARLRGVFRDQLRLALSRLTWTGWLTMLAMAGVAATAHQVLFEGHEPLAMIGAMVALLMLLHFNRLAAGIVRAGTVEGDRILAVLATRRALPN